MTTATQAVKSETDWTKRPLAELIQWIVNEHHSFLEAALPRLRQKLLDATRLDCGRNTHLLREITQVLITMSNGLHEHLMKEESVLFPYVVSLEKALAHGKPRPYTPFGKMSSPISLMEDEHKDVHSALARMRALSNHLVLHEHWEPALREFLSGLDSLEKDINQHTHLENNILYPRARDLDGQFK